MQKGAKKDAKKDAKKKTKKGGLNGSFIIMAYLLNLGSRGWQPLCRPKNYRLKVEFTYF